MPPSATRQQRKPLNPRGAGALQEPRLRVRQAPSKGAFGLTARNLAVGPQIARYMLARTYSAELGFRIGAHALRATAVTNALDNQADIAKVAEWLGHAKKIHRQHGIELARCVQRFDRKDVVLETKAVAGGGSDAGVKATYHRVSA